VTFSWPGAKLQSRREDTSTFEGSLLLGKGGEIAGESIKSPTSLLSRPGAGKGKVKGTSLRQAREKVTATVITMK